MIAYSQNIYSMLSNDSEISELVGTEIYPLVMPENSSMPMIVFHRNFTNEYTKDWITGSDISVSIIVFDLDYKKTVTIASAVDRVLQANNLRLISCDEDYQEGAFMQRLNYTIKTR